MLDLTLLGVGDSITVHTGALWTVFGPILPGHEADDPNKGIDLGIRFTCSAPAEVRAIRFYKAPTNAGPHIVTLWDDTGTVLARAASVTETTFGWQEVKLISPVAIQPGKTYRASYYLPKTGYSYDVDVFTKPLTNGPLTLIDSCYKYAGAPTFPMENSRHANYYVDVVVWTGKLTAPPVIVPPVDPPVIPPVIPPGGVAGKLLSTGASGLVRFGFNQHNSGYDAQAYAALNCKAMRIGGNSINKYYQFNAYPGPAYTSANNNTNAIDQGTTDAAIKAGLDVIVSIIVYGGYSQAQWIKYVTAVAQYNLPNADHVILELGNEPDWNTESGAAYGAWFAPLAKAIHAVSPKIRVAGPTINVSYGAAAIKYVNDLCAVPGIFDHWDLVSYHPYYQTPEASWNSDINAMIQRVEGPALRAGKKNMEYTCDELGWSNAIGAISNPSVENLSPIGGTVVQNPEVQADYYSRSIPMTRASTKMRLVTYYALVDENGPDGSFNNVQAHWGIYDANGLKPCGLVCQDLFPHMHAATDAKMYTRGNDYFVYLKPNNVMIAWTTGSNHSVNLLTLTAQPTNVIWNVAGSKNKTTVPAAPSIAVPLGRRSVVIRADGPIAFPEFT